MIDSRIDGQPAASVALADRGLAYGDGLFETMRVEQGKIALLDRHMQRLQLGCRRLHIPLDIQLVRREVCSFAQELQQGVCKLILTRGDGTRGYGLPQPATPRRILQAAPLPQWPAQNAHFGVCLYPCQTRLAIQPLLAGLKHLNRLEQVLARAEWQDPAFAEGLMLDTSGRIIEGVFSNVFFVCGNTLLTPALSGSGVAGIMREQVLELAAGQGLAVEITDLYPDQLGRMDEVFTCNSLYGIWPVLEYAGHSWPAGPLTRRLQSLINGQDT